MTSSKSEADFIKFIDNNLIKSDDANCIVCLNKCILNNYVCSYVLDVSQN